MTDDWKMTKIQLFCFELFAASLYVLLLTKAQICYSFIKQVN